MKGSNGNHISLSHGVMRGRQEQHHHGIVSCQALYAMLQLQLLGILQPPQHLAVEAEIQLSGMVELSTVEGQGSLGQSSF